MKFIRLLSEKDERYDSAMELYRVSFPLHEQREERSQKEILENESYHFDLIYDNDLFTGIILYWETERFIYVEHFCVNPKLRGRQYGQKSLEFLTSQALREGKTVILEIDPPLDDISIRRKGFYERSQFKANPYPHVHPPYHNGNSGHELVVMSCPDVLSKTGYDRFRQYLEEVVMGQV